MSFENWKKENELSGFDAWQQENLSSGITETLNPAEASKRAEQIWNTSSETGLPINESKSIFSGFYGTQVGVQSPAANGLASRFGKQLYNNLIANTLHTLGKSDLSAAESRTYELLIQWEKDNNIKLTDELFDDQFRDWTVQLTQPPQARESEYLQNEIQYPVPTAVNPFAAEVEEPEAATEKIVDATTGIIGFVTQIALLKKFAPSMPEAAVWETVNLANGGKPGGGAAMQATLAGLGKIIPASGILPAVGRGTAASAIFGTSTYLGGGDTVDILVNMGIPFAFEGMGLTKQGWAKYKNKSTLIGFLKQKAPALKNRPNIEIDKAISDTLTNITAVGAKELLTKKQMLKQFAPKEKPEDLSIEIKDYLQRKRYDELIEKASAGDKKAIKELNDWVTGTKLPTYDELLERGFAGDASAFEQIQLGNYYQEPAPKAELKIPKTKKQIADIQGQRPLTSIEQIKATEDIAIFDVSHKPSKISEADLSKARERGFVTSVKELVPELKIDNQYVPRSTDVLAIKAKNLVKDNLPKAEKIAVNPKNDAGVAIAAEVIKHYANLAESAKDTATANLYHQRIADIANSAAFNLTEGGRFVQAASILSRMTPEGQVRFAAREIQRYNESVAKKKGGVGGLKKQIPELTAQQADYIFKEMKDIAKMPDGKRKAIRFNELQNHVSALVPTPLYKKIITTWKAGLLTGIKTHGLNLFANAFHLGTESAKGIPASAVDKTIAYFTGQRTVTPTIKGIKGGGLEGFKKGIEYLLTGYSERDIGVKLDYQKINMGKGNLAKGLQSYTETVFRLMGSGDQPFYYAAKMRSMFEQAKVSAINQGLKGRAAQEYINNLMQNPTEKMVLNATKDAETAVFINNTKLGDIARGIQKLPGGEIVVPFGRTPSAVAMQIVNYSPVGIAKTIIENIGKGRFDQRAFSQGLGRGITGTAVLVIGASLYKYNMVTLDYPQTEKERKLWELEGRQPNAVKMGNDWRTVQSFGPAGNLLIIGGHFQRAFEESGSPTEAMSTALAGSAKSFTEQTFMRGVNQFVDAISNPERSASYVAGNTISSIIPTIVADVARATDISERRAETVSEKFMMRIPVARRTLEPQVTVLGEEKAPTANPIELMIDPTRPSKEISSFVVTELRRLWDKGWEVSPSQLGTRKGYEPLNREENTKLWKRAGEITKDGLELLFKNNLYEELTDEQKADAVSKIIEAAQNAAKTEMVAEKLSGLKDEEMTKTIFELRKSGLATQDIIPIALSKQKPEAVRKKERR